MRSLRIAFSLLTTLPFRLPDDWSAGDSGRAAVWYPFVGLTVGALTWLAWKGTMFIFHPVVAGIITLAVWVALTGGLHLDGLADCCDGLFSSATPKRRLEIMKDPHLGTFGIIGLILVLLLKAAILGTLTSSASLGIILAASLSRWCVLPAGLLPLARPGGMGADFASGLRRVFIFVSALLPLGITLALGSRGILSALAGLCAAALVLLFARSRIGGVTGDVFGMVIEIVEAIVLLVFSIGVL
ncbi:MAG: adenosylcobinamide-GDP ribazoletransferase [Chloroflexi bacterium]|nr:adenosylcobinamide-GDP ribazoletransferase [Chloroflexota bacterium]MBI3338882.1 adenosylcobinamide-GDP ribazoletransferase [Chloroflexota bacterium]